MDKKASDRLTLARFAVRCAALAAAVVVVGAFASRGMAAVAMVGVSPFVALASALATRTVGWAAMMALPLLVVVLLRRRWFCRWLCPTGLLCEQAGRIGTAAKRRACSMLPLGHWFALMTLAGAVLGYPLFIWLDPLALLASFLGAGWSDPLARATSLSAAGLAAVVVLSVVAPGLWCARVCPLGATQELLATACRCLSAGKTSALGEGASAADNRRGTGLPLARRLVLASGIGAAWAWAVRRRLVRTDRVLRPPGAIDEARFRGVCVRCGNCLRACPTRILHADLGEIGLSSLMSPVVRFDPGYCREDCRRCGEVCPSGAIARLGPGEKRTARMGLAKVDVELCLLTDNRECSICRNCCPYDAITTVWSEEDYTMAVKIAADRCPGCGACEVACPTAPVKAIVVQPSR